MNNLTMEAEFRYIVSWFNEWSELQREDFVPIMVNYLTQDAATGTGVYMNGVVHSVAQVAITDKPMSLFQCRVKLFREWTPKWPLEFKHKLKEKIMEIDTKVGEKIISEIKSENGSTINGSQHEANGYNHSNANEHENGNGATAVAASTADDSGVNAATTIIAVAHSNAETDVDTDAGVDIDVDNSLAALPNNELSVDNDSDVLAAEPAEQVVEMQTQQNVQVVVSNNSSNDHNSNSAEVPLLA